MEFRANWSKAAFYKMIGIAETQTSILNYVQPE